jgi:hypothetical protein
MPSMSSVISPSADSIKSRLILPSSLLYKVPSLTNLAARLSTTAHLLWVSALSRLHFDTATFCAKTTSSSLRSVLRFSQPLDGFFRIQACRLISSRCHAQGSFSFRGFSSLAAVHPRRVALPPCCCCTVARQLRPAFAVRPLLGVAPTCDASQLRGFALQETCVHSVPVIHLDRSRSPLRVALLFQKFPVLANSRLVRTVFEPSLIRACFGFLSLRTVALARSSLRLGFAVLSFR